MTLSPPRCCFPSADFVAFKTSVGLFNYLAAHNERESAQHRVRHLPALGPPGAGEVGRLALPRC